MPIKPAEQVAVMILVAIEGIRDTPESFDRLAWVDAMAEYLEAWSSAQANTKRAGNADGESEQEANNSGQTAQEG